MLKAAKDIAPVAKSQTDAMAAYGDEGAKVDVEYFPAVRILNDRGDYSASMGVLPPWVRPLLKKYHPWYRQGSVATANLAGLAVAASPNVSRPPRIEWTFSANSRKAKMMKESPWDARNSPLRLSLNSLPARTPPPSEILAVSTIISLK
jgi:hypothetical protein